MGTWERPLRQKTREYDSRIGGYGCWKIVREHLGAWICIRLAHSLAKGTYMGETAAGTGCFYSWSCHCVATIYPADGKANMGVQTTIYSRSPGSSEPRTEDGLVKVGVTRPIKAF
jgi:hypothetical protein